MKNQKKIGEILFFIAYILWLSYSVVKLTYFKDLLPVSFIYEIVKIATVILLGLKLWYEKEYSKKEIIGFFISFLLFFIALRVSKEVFAYGILFIYSARNICFNKILKVTILIQGLFLAFTILCSQIGIIPDEMWHESDRYRHGLGFTHCLLGSHLILFITLAYICLRKRITWLEGGGLLLLNQYIAFLTDSRTNKILSVFVIIVAFLFGYCGKKIIELKIFNIGMKYFGTAFFLLSLLGTAFFKVDLLIWERLNAKLNGRLFFGHQAIEQYGFSILGRQIKWIGSSTVQKNPNLIYNYVDNAYLQTTLNYGLIWGILICIALYYAGKLACKNKNYMLCLALVTVGIHGLINPQLFELAYNPFLLFLGQACFGEKISGKGRMDVKKEYKFFKASILYTVCFWGIFTIITIPFKMSGKSFLWSPDAVVYHIPMSEVFIDTVKNVIKAVLRGEPFSFQQINYNLGLGTDVLFYISQWYIEPINFLGLLFSKVKLETFYEWTIILRLYLTGIAFLPFVKRICKKERTMVLSALVYAFSGYTLFTGFKASNFLMAMILLPIMYLCVERIFQKKSALPFISIIFLTSIYSYYFLFINSLLLAIYVMIRVIAEKLSIKEIIVRIIKLMGYYVVGAALGAIVLLPVVLGFLDSSRSATVVNTPSLYWYGFDRIKAVVQTLFVPTQDKGFWTTLGFSPLVLFAVLALLFERKVNPDKSRLKKELFTGWILGAVFIMLPIIGYAFNAFKVINNRYSYGLVFVAALTFAVGVEVILQLEPIKKIILGLIGIIWAFVSFLVGGVENRAAKLTILFFGMCGLTFILVGILEKREKKLKFETILSIMLLITLAGGGYMLFAEKGENFVDAFEKKNKAYDIMTNSEARAVKELDDGSFFRVDGVNLEKKASASPYLTGYHGLITNASSYSQDVADFYNYFENGSCMTSFRLNGMDNSTILTTLSNVRYYTLKEEEQVNSLPYGYQMISQSENKNKISKKKYPAITIYENLNTIPLGYTYDSYILEGELEKLNGVERQNVMLHAAIIEEGILNKEVDKITQLKKGNFENKIIAIPFSIAAKENVELNSEKRQLSVNNKNGNFTIRLSPELEAQNIVQDAELYIRFSGVEILDQEINSITLTVENGNIRKKIYTTSPRFTYASSQNTYCLNLGVVKMSELPAELTISFNKEAKLGYDNIEVFSLPLTDFEGNIERLSEDTLENVTIEGNNITGALSLDKEKILCLSIPYTKGWSAYVDNKKVSVEKINKMYMGVFVEKGVHNIEFKYETPGLKAGAIVSFIGVCSAIFIFIWERKRLELK